MMDIELLHSYINFINKMILDRKIELKEVPFDIRIREMTMYTYSCRAYRNNKKEYMKNLKILESDITKLEKLNEWQHMYNLVRLYEELNDSLEYVY